VQVRPGRASSCADGAQDRAALDPIALAHVDPRQWAKSD
jgi:hypothetical protein